MKKPYLHSAGSIRFGASFINRMLLLCLLGIVMPQAIYSATGAPDKPCGEDARMLTQNCR